MEGNAEESSNRDPGWKYNFLQNPSNKNKVTCKFCMKETSGGIHRAKQHQVGNSRNTKKCDKCPRDVVEELKSYMDGKKLGEKKLSDYEDTDDLFGDEEEIEILGSDPRVGEKRGKEKLELGGASKRGPRPSGANKQGQIKSYFDARMSTKKQTSIVDSCDKEARDRTIQKIARFFYQAGIAFNVAKLDSFKEMIDAIGKYGPNLKPPSYHELRVPLLQKEVAYTQNLLSNHKTEWEKNGCSIMADGWTDRNRRSIINFMVNCALGTMFLESIDVSAIEKSGSAIYDLLDRFVEKVGEKNVVQVVTDNGANFKLAGNLLEIKRPHIYWTPCAAHCVDLMLEDIGKIPSVKRTIERGIFLVGYIYNHHAVLTLMKSFTNDKNLVRHGVTRFATTFLTLTSIHKQKHQLRAMFTSEKWVTSKWAKEVKGKRAQEIVMMASFWNNVLYVLKIMGPLVRVLRLVDNERKPAMGYIYEAMDRAKETIAKSFNENLSKYGVVYKIIDERWNCQLHRPLHAAAHYLNPSFFFSDPSIERNPELVLGLTQCIEKMVPSASDQDKIMEEITKYKAAAGLFGIPMAIRCRKTKSPGDWWSMYGCEVPKLQELATRILSLTCSATGCERNWSVFEQIHSKKRNKLSHDQLKDLVYCKYNQALKARYDLKDTIDPISLQDIDECNEWLVGEMGANIDAAEELVDGEGSLSWGNVETATGAGEPSRTTRQTSKSRLVVESRLVDESEEEQDIMQENDEDDDLGDDGYDDYDD